MMPHHRTTLVNLIVLVAAVVVSLYAAELILRMSPLSDKLGWNRVIALSKRVAQFNPSARIKIVVLGDSFAEWRAGEGLNMFDQLRAASSAQGYSILNLGRGGTDIDMYVAIYRKYVHFTPELVVICFYLGNDIHKYASYGKIEQISVEDSIDLVKNKWLLFLKKHSILANLAFRFAKDRIPFLQSGFFEGNVKALQKENGIPDEVLRRRLQTMDSSIVASAKSDAINPWLPAIGLINPEYYKELFGLRTPDAYAAADASIGLISQFKEKEHIKNLLVVFIPESLQVSASYDGFFRKCGFDLDGFTLDQRRNITRYIETKLQAGGIQTLDCIPTLEKETNPYIPFDTHLNAQGHKAIGRLLAAYLKDARFK
jgi:hypothetical protein